mmetsp:Transcript_38265/g.76666  ORF Transcript_38265/g.76666 Transcript_38265/m.76666 type:complete len:121 (-) Transcript_38265:3-365(-)
MKVIAEELAKGATDALSSNEPNNCCACLQIQEVHTQTQLSTNRFHATAATKALHGAVRESLKSEQIVDLRRFQSEDGTSAGANSLLACTAFVAHSPAYKGLSTLHPAAVGTHICRLTGRN